MKSDDEMKLTAYALGELDEADRAAVESRVWKDAAARAEVERIRDVAKLLSDELAAEPVPMTRAIDVAQLQPRRRQPRWGGRLAIAASVSVVVGSIAYSVLAPPRRNSSGFSAATQADLHANAAKQQEAAATRRPTEYQQAKEYRANNVPAPSTPAASAATDEKKVPYDDILRYPVDGPAVTSGMANGVVTAHPPSNTPAPAFSLSTPAPAPATEAEGRFDHSSLVTRQPAAQAAQIGGPALQETASAPFGVPAKTSAGTLDLSSGLTGGLSSPGQQPQQQLQQQLGRPASPNTLARGTASTATGINAGDGVYAMRPAVSDGADFGGKLPERARGLDLREEKLQQEQPDRKHNTEAYDRVVDNAFLDVMQNPLSTFSIDVDTASYSNMRRFLTAGQKPPKDSVRIEELVNYFPYQYEGPGKDATEPFATHVEIADCPWRPEHRLVRVAIKGKEIAADKRPASNLVFLLDVSGSMQPENKLPLVKRSMQMLLDQLHGEDRVAIVVYAGNSGLALPSTACTEGAKDQILGAIGNLSAGGSTNGEQGIQLAYTIAKQNFIEGGTNRVILCTDGDFNVGVTNQGDLLRLIEDNRVNGVSLSVLGFGMGNLKDSTMEKLADRGNGNYSYIDSLNEAQKVLVEEAGGTLVTLAKDVKLQVEFNPRVVAAYRLVGYENRLLQDRDFNDDKKDAGDMGAGHSVTALYEIAPAGEKLDLPGIDPLKYQQPPALSSNARTGEAMTVKVRYKEPDGVMSSLVNVAVPSRTEHCTRRDGRPRLRST